MRKRHYIKYQSLTDSITAISKIGVKPKGSGWREVDGNYCCILPAFTAIVATDFHARNDGDKGVYLQERLPTLLSSINSYDHDYVFDIGDSLDGNHSVPGTGTLAEQRAIYDEFKAGLQKPLYNIIGNHDVHGSAAGFTPAAAVSYFNMPNKYHYKDFPGNWRMIFLYSMGDGDGQVAYYSLGATQTTWLNDLISQSQDKNVCIMTHVPILSVSSPVWRIYNNGTNPIQTTVWNARNSHADVKPLLEMCRLNSCIKLCMSGHEHSYDDCLMFNTRFMCMGSTSAFYWNRENHWWYQYAGFSKMNFYKDGTFDREIVYY